MKTTNNVRLAQRLYQMIINNLLVILLLIMAIIIIWLFGYLNTSVSKTQQYNPISRQQAILYVLQHINTQTNNVGIKNKKATNFTFNQDDSKCLVIADDSKINKRIETINANLQKLYDSKFLNHKYQLDKESLIDDFCGVSITEQDLGYAVRILAKKGKLQQLNWAEKRDPFLTKTTQVGYVTMPNNWLVQRNPWFGLPGCVYVGNQLQGNQKISYLGKMNNDTLARLCNHTELLPPNATSLISNATNNNDELPIKSSEENKLALPSDLARMYSDLHNLQSSHFDKELIDAYEAYHDKYNNQNWFSKLFSAPVNSIDIDGADVKIGYNMQLTLDSELQAKVQHIAECMTSNVKTVKCDDVLSERMQTDAKSMYENSLVRSIGVAVLDVKNQSILALGSAHSDCYAYDNGANNQDNDTIKNCPKLWNRDWSGEKLLNHAVYQYAPPGSIVKPTQALAIVRSSPIYQKKTTPQYKYLQRVMASSSTKRVANYLLCAKTSSNYTIRRQQNGVCPTISAFQQSSVDMGWSVNCQDTALGGHCGFKDILFGLPYQSEPMIQSRYFAGRLLTDSKHLYDIKNISAKNVQSCIDKNKEKGRTPMSAGCGVGGDELTAFMSEIYGAGNAKSSVLGAVDMFSSLLIADNGEQQRRGAHLIDELWGVKQLRLRPKAWRGDADYGEYDNLAMQPINISRSEAHQTLGLFYGTLKPNAGLSKGVQDKQTIYGNGSGYRSCQQAIGDCRWMADKIVSKTGTPGFNYQYYKKEGSKTKRLVTIQKVTTAMVKKRCYNSKNSDPWCYNRPYKWFIMGIPDNTGKWDKAVAILVERNWKKTGVVDDPKDSINRAVQAGSILAKVTRQ